MQWSHDLDAAPVGVNLLLLYKRGTPKHITWERARKDEYGVWTTERILSPERIELIAWARVALPK